MTHYNVSHTRHWPQPTVSIHTRCVHCTEHVALSRDLSHRTLNSLVTVTAVNEEIDSFGSVRTMSTRVYLIYTVSKKRGVELFTITSSTVNRFWKSFYCWKQQWIIYKIKIIRITFIHHKSPWIQNKQTNVTKLTLSRYINRNIIVSHVLECVYKLSYQPSCTRLKISFLICLTGNWYLVIQI